MSKIGFLFYGRLEAEKGFDAILDMIEIWGNQNQYFPFEIYIFGKGTLESRLISLSHKYPTIHFFGRQSLDYIKQYLSKVQYLLMPSGFLETFGLSALNSLSRGLPVVGYAKGGLTKFILPPFDLSNMQGINTARKLHNMILQIISNPPEINTITLQNIALEYTPEHRFKNFQKTFGPGKKIIMISDFKTKVGGIETYIHDVKSLLESKGYEIKLYGYNIPKSRISKFIKYFGLVWAFINFVSMFKIIKIINKTKPDIIRYHSTLRWIGRLGILASKNFKGQKFVMYHDFGYFYPFPHSLNFVYQIQTPLTLKNYIKSADTYNPIKIIAIFFKYLSVYLIKNQLKKSNFKHLTPSDFMVDIVADSYQISKKRIQAFPHFIQE
ncbi:MAG: glycosyltransferase [Candidatus Absconditicoccaceae bacterium]